MQFFTPDTIKKILRNKKKLQQKLKVSITLNPNSSITTEGDELNVFTAEKVLDAMDSHFPMDIALMLVDPDYVLEHIPVKDFTRKKALKEVKGRLIGSGGRTLELLSELSECYITLKENTVNIIGSIEKIKFAENAVKSVIHGSKTANVYSYLEKARHIQHPDELGIKPKFKKLRV